MVSHGRGRCGPASFFGGKASGSFYAGDMTNGKEASKNSITISGAGTEVGAYLIYGAWSRGEISSENSVTIKEGAKVTASGEIAGSLAASKTIKNSVIIDSATVTTVGIFGGQSGEASENSVTIKGDAVVTANGEGINGAAYGKSAIKNEVNVEDTATIIGSILGGKTGGTADGNKVNIGKDANIENVPSITGGNGGNANDNEVNIGGDTKAVVIAGNGKTGADGNKVKIDGNADGAVTGGISTNGNADGNNVAIVYEVLSKMVKKNRKEIEED